MYTRWERNWLWNDPTERTAVLVGAFLFVGAGLPIIGFFYATTLR